MAKRSGKAKPSTRSRAASKGWATRRARAEELARKKAAAQRKRAATLRHKAEAREKRREAGRKGARRHRVRVRAQAALDALKSHEPEREWHGQFTAGLRKRLHESWLRAKDDVFNEADSYEDYLDMLELIAEESDVQWDIAYGPESGAAVA